VLKKRHSAKPSRSSKKKSLGEDLIEGVRSGIAHLKGEITLRERRYEIPDRVDVKQVREALGLSQTQFAMRYGFNPRTLQEWEQGRTQPDTAARAYLTLIAKEPEIVTRALTSA